MGAGEGNFGELWDTGKNIIFGGGGVMALDRYVDPAQKGRYFEQIDNIHIQTDILDIGILIDGW